MADKDATSRDVGTEGQNEEGTSGSDHTVSKSAAAGKMSEASAEPQPEATADDMERVRQIIMGGGDGSRQPIRDVEAKRLRDALFGTKMEEYERRLADSHRDNDRVANDLRQLRDVLDEAREAQQERVDSVERDTAQKMEELTRSLEQVRAQAPLLQQLVSQTRQLQVLVQRLSEELSDLQSSYTRETQDLRALRSTVEQYRDQYERGIDTLKREKRQAEDEIKAELRQMADRLDSQKVDRRALAAVLLEIATRLETGNTASDILHSFVEPTED
jgi:chromosome segregation ATPase